MQTHTSARTSVAQVPALHKVLAAGGVWDFGAVNADIGGGAYDLATEYLRGYDVTNCVYDPYNRGEDYNRSVYSFIVFAADTATVSNVLNVIKERDVRIGVIQQARIAGRAFFSVYERDRSGEGCETRSGWQENRRLESYLDEILEVFDHAEVRRSKGFKYIEAW